MSVVDKFNLYGNLILHSHLKYEVLLQLSRYLELLHVGILW